MYSLIVVAMASLDGVGSQEDRRLGRAVDLVGQNAVFHLKVEEPEGDVLDDFLGDIFGVELRAELELQGVLLLDVLAHHL